MPSLTVTRKSFNVKVTAKIDVPIGYLYGQPLGSKGFQNLIKTSKTGKDLKERKKDLKKGEKDLKSR